MLLGIASESIFTLSLPLDGPQQAQHADADNMPARHMSEEVAFVRIPTQSRRGRRVMSVGAALNCSALVPIPIDVHPIRSPQVIWIHVSPPIDFCFSLDFHCTCTQVVHSVITRHLKGKSLVEIGTRNGDGMACFARAAREAVAVEMDKDYCRKLELVAKSIGEGGRAAFTVRCDRYQALALDADVFTWWQQSPHLKNVEVLQHLHAQQQAQHIRPNAEAIVLFEVGFPDDMQSYQRIKNFTSWSETVHFDEAALCRKRIRKPWFVKRARGSFRVVGVRLADVRL